MRYSTRAYSSIHVLMAMRALWGTPDPSRAQHSIHAREANGQAVFQSHCSSCHGLDGRGGEHAPDIVTNPAVKSLSNQALIRTIEDGLPRTAMPGFKNALARDEIAAVVAFLRRGGGNNAAHPLPGNPDQGKALFFGKGGCADCHVVNGKGGFLASDLTAYGRGLSPAEIKDSILHRAGAGSRALQSATVRTKGGKEWSGVVRNEDNFSIQLLDTRGVFHLFMKSDLAAIHRESRLTPDDRNSRLTAADLDNLAAFLTGSGR